MNKDLIIGLVASVAIHLVVLNPWSKTAPPPPKPVVVEEDIIQFEMPPLPPEEEEEVEELDDEPIENQLAPPTLMDVPSPVVTEFQQVLTPPPPPDINVSKGAISIPVTKPGAGFGRGLKDLFDLNNLDQRPVARIQGRPAYPYEMSRAGIEGEVVVEFIISANGDVIDTRVVSSSHKEFEVPAMQAVSKWKFKPGRKGGRAVATRAVQAIAFTLEADS